MVENLADIFSVAFDQLSIKFPSFKNLLFFLFFFQKSARLKNRRGEKTAREYSSSFFPFPNPCVFQTGKEGKNSGMKKKVRKFLGKGSGKDGGKSRVGRYAIQRKNSSEEVKGALLLFFSRRKNWEKAKG